MNQKFKTDINKYFSKTLKTNEQFKNHTTIGVGGPADYYLAIMSKLDLLKAYKLASDYKIPIFIFGGGTNIIVSDEGFRGLVIQSKIQDFEIIQTNNNHHQPIDIQNKIAPRLKQVYELTKYNANKYNASYTNSTPQVMVKVGSGWKINALIQRCLENKITGLEWFGGIPGTVGGAVYMNIHGGNYFLSDFVVEVEVIDKNKTRIFKNKQLMFDYDYSIFHKKKYPILSVTFRLYRGDIIKAMEIFRYWNQQKILNQPQRSAGCVWQNLTHQQISKHNLPSSSIGYIIDKVLNLKGSRKGDAQLSTKHAGFIENIGNASYVDTLSLVKSIESDFRKKFGVSLKREIEFIK